MVQRFRGSNMPAGRGSEPRIHNLKRMASEKITLQKKENAAI
jgi:hypothetical protein